jgi:hypothetical protein
MHQHLANQQLYTTLQQLRNFVLVRGPYRYRYAVQTEFGTLLQPAGRVAANAVNPLESLHQTRQLSLVRMGR